MRIKREFNNFIQWNTFVKEHSLHIHWIPDPDVKLELKDMLLSGIYYAFEIRDGDNALRSLVTGIINTQYIKEKEHFSLDTLLETKQMLNVQSRAKGQMWMTFLNEDERVQFNRPIGEPGIYITQELMIDEKLIYYQVELADFYFYTFEEKRFESI